MFDKGQKVPELLDATRQEEDKTQGIASELYNNLELQ
jgi:hypothetical protein